MQPRLTMNRAQEFQQLHSQHGNTSSALQSVLRTTPHQNQPAVTAKVQGKCILLHVKITWIRKKKYRNEQDKLGWSCLIEFRNRFIYIGIYFTYILLLTAIRSRKWMSMARSSNSSILNRSTSILFPNLALLTGAARRNEAALTTATKSKVSRDLV